jgi:hypothetical protein
MAKELDGFGVQSRVDVALKSLPAYIKELVGFISEIFDSTG